MLPKIILDNLKREGSLAHRRRSMFVVGYSGGIDSTVLLHVLAQAREAQNISLVAACFDHGWRGRPLPELPVLHQTCAALQVPLVIVPADPQLPRTETAGRDARYRALTALAEDLGADALLTAHHADDQVETLLFRLFRGTGVDGLEGIQKRLVLDVAHGAPVPILRPMLDIYRDGIRQYAEQHRLAYFSDPTNDTTQPLRNAIRHDILPPVLARFPHAKSALLRLTEIVAGDLDILDEKLEGLWREVRTRKGDSDALDTLRFNQLGRPYQRRLIRRFLAEQGVEADFHRVEEVVDFIDGEHRRKPSSALLSLTRRQGDRNRFLSLYRNRLSVIEVPASTPVASAEAPQTPVAVEVRVPGVTVCPALGLILRIRPVRPPAAGSKTRPDLRRPRTGLEMAVNLGDYRTLPLVLRTRRQGDRIRPFGMPVSMRLKNYFINRGVPRFERDAVPLLACEGTVLWAIGVGIHEALRVSGGQPTHTLSVELTRDPARLAAAAEEPDVLPEDSEEQPDAEALLKALALPGLDEAQEPEIYDQAD